MKAILSILFIAATIAVQAQDVEFKASNFKDDKEGFKKAEDALKAGDEVLELANEDVALVRNPGNKFKQALVHYKKAYDFNPNSAELNMKMGNCYLYTTKRAEAIPYLEKAYELNPEIDPMLFFYLGQTKQLQMKFAEAQKMYKKFEEESKNKYVEEYKKIVSKYKKECKYGKEITAEKLRVWVDNLEDLNSKEDDHSPCLSADGEVLVFASSRKNGHDRNKLGEYDNDIYITKMRGSGFDRDWEKPKNIGAPLSTPENEVASALSYDGQRMLLFKTKNDQADVYQSVLKGVDWQEPQLKMGSNINSEYNETYACYEPNDIKIHYIYDGGSKRDKDIFFSGLMVRAEGTWGKGQSVGSSINTSFHEGSIYIHPDGKSMYFSSQGHNSIGGYDIFYITRDERTGQWSQPKNLGYPINTPYDELFFAPTASGKYAYIASNREGGKGGLDLYKITFWGPEKPVAVGTEDYLLASIAEPIIDNNIKAPVQVEKKSLTVFKGKTIDHITKKPVEASFEIVDNSNGKVVTSSSSNSATGKFLLSLPSGKNYGIAVKKPGYLFHSENFNLPKDDDYNMVDKTIELKNIKIGSKIALRNVFFATGKSDITSESYPELDRLVQLLKDVPALKIELSGHTDNKGSEELNKKLSQSRAEAVQKYLTQKGISASRLTAKGYGSDRPVATNSTSAGRQLNRRTEFEITAN